MQKEIKGMILSRLIILISIVALPIVIFLTFFMTDFTLPEWFSKDPVLNFWIIKILCPLIFSISWLFFMILFATRLSVSIESMDKTIAVVPIRLKVFFGANALFILFIFVLPLITPLISALSFSSMAWRLTHRKESWDDQKVSLITKILMVLFCILPVLCSILILPQYIILAISLWELWIELLPILLSVSYCIYTALAIGSLFVLIANRGVSEYEQILQEPTSEMTIWYIRIGELFMFVFFLFLEFSELEIVLMFYYAGFFIGIFVAIVNFIIGKRKNASFKSYFIGYFLAALFMGANLLIMNEELSYMVQIISLIFSAILFISIFVITFLTLKESEMTT